MLIACARSPWASPRAPPLDRERLAVHRLGPVQVALLLEEEAEVVQGGGRVEVSGAEELLPDPERLAVERLGLRPLPLVVEERGEVVQAGRHLAVLGAEDAPADLEGLPQVGLRLGVEAEGLVGLPQRRPDGGLDLGLLPERAASDLSSRLVEHPPDGHVLPLHLRRVDRREHLLEEGVHRRGLGRLAPGGPLARLGRGALGPLRGPRPLGLGLAALRLRLPALRLRPPLLGEAAGPFGLLPPPLGQGARLLRLGESRGGEPLGPPSPDRLPRADADPGDEREDGGGRPGHEGPVAPRELAELVRRARGARHDRLVGEVAAQVRAELRGRLVAPLLLLLERPGGNRLDVAAELPAHRAERARVHLADDTDALGQVRLPEVVRQVARQDEVEEDPERVDVAARVERERVSQDLLGTHVRERSDDLADVGLHRGLDVRVGDARQAEVEDPGLARILDEDVPGLQVAVDDPLLVGVVHGVADAGDEVEPLADAGIPLRHVLVEGASRHELHREVRLGAVPRVRHPGLVDLRDPRVAEPPQRVRLLLEPLEQGGGGQAWLDHLEGDDPARPLLLRFVDRPHPPLADHAEDPVAGNQDVGSAGAGRNGLPGKGVIGVRVRRIRPRGRQRHRRVAVLARRHAAAAPCRASFPRRRLGHRRGSYENGRGPDSTSSHGGGDSPRASPRHRWSLPSIEGRTGESERAPAVRPGLSRRSVSAGRFSP